MLREGPLATGVGMGGTGLGSEGNTKSASRSPTIPFEGVEGSSDLINASRKKSESANGICT